MPSRYKNLWLPLFLLTLLLTAANLFLQYRSILFILAGPSTTYAAGISHNHLVLRKNLDPPRIIIARPALQLVFFNYPFQQPLDDTDPTLPLLHLAYRHTTPPADSTARPTASYSLPLGRVIITLLLLSLYLRHRAKKNSQTPHAESPPTASPAPTPYPAAPKRRPRKSRFLIPLAAAAFSLAAFLSLNASMGVGIFLLDRLAAVSLLQDSHPTFNLWHGPAFHLQNINRILQITFISERPTNFVPANPAHFLHATGIPGAAIQWNALPELNLFAYCSYWYTLPFLALALYLSHRHHKKTSTLRTPFPITPNLASTSPTKPPHQPQ